jgi:hypothetical protein
MVADTPQLLHSLATAAVLCATCAVWTLYSVAYSQYGTGESGFAQVKGCSAAGLFHSLLLERSTVAVQLAYAAGWCARVTKETQKTKFTWLRMLSAEGKRACS